MEYISLSYASLGIAVLFIVSAMVVSCRYSLGLERDLAVGAVRAFVQLTAIGYVLQLLFVSARWYYVVIMLIIMLAAAIKNAVDRQSAKLKGMFTTLGISIFVGSALTTAVVIGIILRVRPWYSPRYLIPLAGSILGNSMTGAALALNRLRSDITHRKPEVEAALALGATSRQAIMPMSRDALKSAMLPSISSLMVVGIVHLPGMMAGQIIAGAFPVDAVKYQLMVVYMIAAAVAITSMMVVYLATNLFFTPDHMLKTEALGST